MANTAEIRVPSAQVEGSDSDSVTLSWSLPVSSGAVGCPNLKYSSHPDGGDKVINPTAATLITAVAAAQKQLFAAPAQKTVILNDGKNSYTFTGFDSGPHHEVTYGGVNNGQSVTHVCSKLQYLNTSIYVAPVDKSMLKLSIEPKAATSVAGYMRVVLEDMLTSYKDSQDTANSGDAEAVIRETIHNSNKTIINDYWYPILEASAGVTFEGFASFVEDKNNCEALADAILTVYSNQAADFFIKMDQFSTMFQMLFVPDYKDTSKPGKFISYKDVVNSPTPKTVSIRALSMQPGARSFLPCTSVAMLGLPNGSLQHLKMDGTVSRAALASWPDPVPTTGTIATISAPPWIPADICPDKDIQVGENLDCEAYAAALDAENGKTKDITDGIIAIAKDFCHVNYVYSALSDATATVVTLLDFTWEPGKRYTVKQDAGGNLFDGFLRGVEHRIASSPGRTDATTQLIFSHVEANGFTLPNK
jgi:hypothetical protein